MLTCLALTNSIHSPTGYGTQARQLLTRMRADGHAVAVAANYGVESQGLMVEGIHHFPRGFEGYSNDVVKPYMHDWSARNPDGTPLLLTLFDVWVYGDNPAMDELPVASWVPIDHDPIPPKVAEFCSKPSVRPIAMSKFGQAAMRARDIECAYVPHAIETSVYKPTPRVRWGDRDVTGRELLGIPEDAFVVGCADANKGIPPRKGWGERLQSFAAFAKRHDDAVLLLHTERFGAMAGIRFDDLIAACGIDPARVHFTDQYALRMGIPPEVVAGIHSAMDCLLATSYGEGFGLGVVEAQAAGVPVIVSDFTAQPELVGDGLVVGGQKWWDAPQGSWWLVPSVPETVEALEAMYDRPRGPSTVARDFVLANYDADAVYAQMWRPLLAEFEQ